MRHSLADHTPVELEWIADSTDDRNRESMHGLLAANSLRVSLQLGSWMETGFWAATVVPNGSSEA